MDKVDQILNMDYGELFEPSKDRIKERYLELVKIYHPDSWKDKRAGELFAHITELKNAAVSNLEKGIWQKKDKISFEMKKGGWASVFFKEIQEFELGKKYIGENSVLYCIDEDNIDFYEHALDAIKKLDFANEDMKKEFTPVLPRIIRNGTSSSGQGILIIEKDANEYPLNTFLKKMGNQMEPRHVAWMISRLCSICCYLQYKGISHNGLTLDNIFINPIDHRLTLYGGWWYAVNAGEKLIGTTAEVYEIMSEVCTKKKLAELRTDQEMVHEIAKILLNNKSLVFKKTEVTDIPSAMATWIRAGTCGNAFAEFENWNITLDNSWDGRKFVKLDFPEIY